MPRSVVECIEGSFQWPHYPCVEQSHCTNLARRTTRHQAACSSTRPLLIQPPAGKTQLVKGKLAALGPDTAHRTISLNYFTDVALFQKVLEAPLEKQVRVGECAGGSLPMIAHSIVMC